MVRDGSDWKLLAVPVSFLFLQACNKQQQAWKHGRIEDQR